MFRVLLTACLILFASCLYADSTLTVSTTVGGSTATTNVDPVTFSVSGQDVTIANEGSESVKYEITVNGLKIGNIIVPSFAVVDDEGNVVVNVTHDAGANRAETQTTAEISRQIAMEQRTATADEPQFTEQENYNYRYRRGLFRRRR